MKFIALIATFVSVFAQAGEFKLTDSCKESLEAQALQAETASLEAQGESLASKLEARSGLSYWPNRSEVTVSVRLEDAVDGRYVLYSANVLKTEALECNIPLARKDSSACRYSRGEGPESLGEIRGLKFKSGRTIKPGSELSKLEQDQIRAFLDSDGSNAGVSLRELIKGTDDHALSTGTLALPGGRTLTYFGAYGGDNPFGIFFKAGTTQVAGNNGDGSVCIK